MSDYQTSLTVSLNTVARCWKMTEFGTLTLLVLLRLTNPIFKIGMALHIGLQTMLILAYSVIVYYKANPNSDPDESPNKGLFQRITGFIPNLIRKLAAIIVKVLIYFLKFNKSNNSQSNIDNYSFVLAYLLITFRKMLALMAAIYITAEDDESTHIKAIAIYSLLIPIQMKFINSMLFAKKSKTESCDKLSFINGLRVILTFENSKSVDSSLLQLVRNRLFLITNFVVPMFFYYTFGNALESLDNDLIWNGLIKVMILLDALFSASFIVELYGLKINFMNSNDTIV